MGIGKLVSVPIHCTHDLYNTFQVQNSLFYYSTTAPANATVIALSVLLIIVGVVMAATSICQLVAGMKMDDDNLLCHCFIGSVCLVL